MLLRCYIGGCSRLVALLLAVLLLHAPAVVAAGHAEADIYVVLSNDTEEYRQIEKRIVEGLRDSRHYGKRLRTMLAASLDPSRPGHWPAADAEVVVAVGMRALKALLEGPSGFPIYAVFVPYASYHALLDEPAPGSGASRRRHLSVLYLDQPPRRQLKLAATIDRSFRRLGILLSEDLPIDVDALREAAADLGLTLRPVRVSERRDVVPALKRAQRRIDLLITVFDPAIISTQSLRQILYFSYNRRLPVIGYSRAMVRAGALAAVYSDAEQVGRQAAETLIEALDRSPIGLPPSAFPDYFSASCNEAVRAYFNLPADCDLKDFARGGEGR